MVSGGWSDTVQIWDIRAKKVVRKISGPHISGDALDICGNTIMTGQYKTEAQLQLWDLGTGKVHGRTSATRTRNRCSHSNAAHAYRHGLCSSLPPKRHGMVHLAAILPGHKT